MAYGDTDTEDYFYGAWVMEKIEKTCEALKANNVEAVLASDGEEALKAALERIPEGSAVGLGGSVTVQQIGLLKALDEGNYTLFNQYEEGISREENLERRKKGLVADVFVTGTNALTEDGQLVNVDGMGNRVAALAFGPAKVLVVVGRNKICDDVHAAFERIRKVAAPRNNERVGINNPCVEAGECQDCKSPSRICNMYSIIRRQMVPGRMTVIIVNEDLGF